LQNYYQFCKKKNYFNQKKISTNTINSYKNKASVLIEIENINDLEKLNINILPIQQSSDIDEVTKAIIYGMTSSKEFTKKLSDTLFIAKDDE
jgi:hypothetical protein